MRKEVRLTFIQAVVFFFVFLLLRCCDSKKTEGNCPPSSCGVLQNQIEYPFRLKTDPKNCGDPQYELACESNQTVLHLHSKKYYVDRITYDRKVIHVVDPGLRSEDFSSLPLYSMSKYEFNESDPYVFATEVKIVTFLNCSVPMDNHSQMLSATACVNQSSEAYLYAVPGWILVRDLPTTCKIEIKGALASVQKFRNPTYLDVFNGLLMGFELSWMEPLSCRDCFAKGRQCSIYPGTSAFVPFLQKRKYCFSNNGLFPSFQGFIEILAMVIYVGGYYAIVITVMALLVRATIGIPCLLVFLSCKLRRKHIWMDTTVEEFLSRYRCQTPARYSYSNIRKMTGRFKEKLGQGGYGSVYKGKLRNGRLVAIKILSGKSKGNGQEFINEVATIGRIHHVNVVRLIGFCAEGSKRALIYEFMPNGSLEKYIYPHEGKSSPLSWEKMYQIALGIARGIEYLHRGCDMKILHFDIKPHNILLDDNFNPKVSDFGLAKFYPTDESIVSVTAVEERMSMHLQRMKAKFTCRRGYMTSSIKVGTLEWRMPLRMKRKLRRRCL